MKILHVVESLYKYGGANVACLDIANRQASQGHIVSVFSTNVESGEEVEQSSQLYKVVKCKRIDLPFGRFRIIKNLKNNFIETLKTFQPDIIHVHALWDPLVHTAIKLGHKYNIPLIHSPHGMLTPWALSNKATKKKIAWNLYQKNDLKKINRFHVTCEEEKKDLIRLGINAPISIIPLGIDIQDYDLSTKKESKKILFISRIHPKKGLINLVEAWHKIQKEGWKILICGPDDDNHEQEVKQKIEELGLNDFFEFKGPVTGSEKNNLFKECDLFILPTHSENFGIVVLEALSFGMPVITTKGSPWESINQYNAGWWVEIGVDPLEHALTNFLSLTKNEKLIIGKNAQNLAKEKFSWDIIINHLLEIYKEIIK